MRPQGARTVRLAPIDDDNRPRPHHDLDVRHVDAGIDERIIRAHIKSERSAAFWMAASIWGVSGLVIGACLGAYMTFALYTGVTPTVRANLLEGAAMDAARDTVNSRPSILHDETNPSPSTP